MPSFDNRVLQAIKDQAIAEVQSWNEHVRHLFYPPDSDATPPGIMVMTPKQEARYLEEMGVLAVKQPTGAGGQVIDDPTVQRRTAELAAAEAGGDGRV
jgi:hypothetical protein